MPMFDFRVSNTSDTMNNEEKDNKTPEKPASHWDLNSPLSGHLHNIEKTYNELTSTLAHINYLIDNITQDKEEKDKLENSDTK
ncbi:MAG: hypothetical protein ACXITV_08510 [Luteibaculaceae bacterium]